MKTLHNLLRKHGEVRGKLVAIQQKIKLEFKYLGKNHSTTIDSGVKCLVDAAAYLSLAYEPGNAEKMKWMSPMCPLVSLYSSFKFRLKELRMDVSKFPIGKEFFFLDGEDLNSSKKNYCTLCKKKFSNGSNFNRHQREKHERDMYEVECDICSVGILKRDLVRHNEICHNEDKKQKPLKRCENVGKSFITIIIFVLR